jgi:enoyl-CoA hydratase/carnithine racemase
MNATTTKITLERRGHLALIGLNRVEKRNAFDLEMLAALSEAYTEFADDPTLRAGVLFAHGDHFTGGLDLGSLAPVMNAGGFDAIFPKTGVDPLGIFSRPCPKPVVTAVKGVCFTIGIELSLAGCTTVAAPDTRFAQIEPARGFMAFGGATVRWPQLCGSHNALRYLLTGEEFDGNEAYRIGLVQEVAPAAEVLDRAIAIAEKMAAQAPLAVQATLQSVRTGIARGPQAAFDEFGSAMKVLLSTKDAARGAQAFATRTPATFEGD